MIEQLSHSKEHINQILYFVNYYNDFWSDFYHVDKNSRIYFKNNIKLIEKVLKNQQMFALKEDEIKAILYVQKEAGFRTYIRFLSHESKWYKYFLSYMKWIMKEDLYTKVKLYNPILKAMTDKIEFKNSVGYNPKEGISIVGCGSKEITLCINKLTI